MPNESTMEAPAGGDRRALPRHRVACVRSRIAWRERGYRMRIRSARLVDINERGARVDVRGQFRPDMPVWVGLNALPCEWVRAEIRALRPEGDRWALHLAFTEPCPAGLLEVAIQGPCEEPSGPEDLRFPFHFEYGWNWTSRGEGRADGEADLPVADRPAESLLWEPA